MTQIIIIAMWIVVAVTALPMIVVIVECLAALLPGRRRRDGDRISVAVLVPAHNEQDVLGPTLAGLKQRLRDGDRLVVIADNCTDATAAIARDAGAAVVERFHDTERGKGYALAAGIKSLDEAPPQVVVFVDADCELSDGGLDALVRMAARTGRPVQGVYLMHPPDRADVKSIVSAFAFLVKNLVRPTGLTRLGQPVLLTGSGMAFPWPIIRDANLATSNIVEDLNIGLDLAIKGYAPRLCEDAHVTATLPGGSPAAVTQRSRWEHGYLSTLLTRVPQLVGGAFVKLRPSLLAIALDLCVPPLSLLVLLAIAAWTIVLIATVTIGVWSPLLTLSAVLMLFTAALFIAWARFAREQLPLGALLSAPAYVLWKLPIYLRFLRGQEKDWVRTERDPGPR